MICEVVKVWAVSSRKIFIADSFYTFVSDIRSTVYQVLIFRYDFKIN
jgi:hypothetical protein